MPFVLHKFRYYHGARLVNAERNAEYRIIDVRSERAAIIDSAAHPEAKAEKLAPEFRPGTWFDVYDYGVGDELVWPYVVSVTRMQDGAYRVNAPAGVKVRPTRPVGAQPRRQ